jgi:hypothetical protein
MAYTWILDLYMAAVELYYWRYPPRSCRPMKHGSVPSVPAKTSASSEK